MDVVQLWPQSPLANFNYLIIRDREALIVDPFDFNLIKNELEKRMLQVVAVINTHSHWDHVKANLDIIENYNVPVIVHANSINKIPGASISVCAKDRFFDEGNNWVEIMETPGHTEDHICLKIIKNKKVFAVLSRDTLFNAGVGNCKNGGNPVTLYNTISTHFHRMEDEVLIYPGHDYLKNNLKFTLSIEPSNTIASQLLAEIENEKSTPYCSKILTIGEERKINTFFRLHQLKVRQSLKMVGHSDKEVFIKLRSLRDNW